jgi:arylsulfatase A-like enzyme
MTIKQISIVTLVVILLSCQNEVKSSSIEQQASNTQKPNVIIIMTDDQGYGDLSCHGNPDLKTPNIDQFYNISVRLTDFHVSPTCSPTRAALMTGRYNNRTGVWHTIMGRSLLREDEVTIADIMLKNDYKTGMFGKWHLGDNYPFRPHDRGFQEAVYHGGGGIGQGLDFFGNDYFDDVYYRNEKPEKFKGYCTDIWFHEAIAFIEKTQNYPFFCYIPTNTAHGPFFVPEKYSQPFSEKGISSPLAEFYGMISNIDENFGKLYAKLGELNLIENTILIFMTDNGGEMGYIEGKYNAGMRGFKGSPYDGGHRVPFFIRWPAGGIGNGRDVTMLTAHIDILPTLIDLCDLIYDKSLNFDGISLKSVLKGSKTTSYDRILITDSQRIDHPLKWRKSAAMKDKWRLINGEDLYDIKTDPGQRQNIAQKNPEIVNELKLGYESWWQSISKRFEEYCPIIIGSDSQNPTCLMSHDIHGQVVWNHRQISRMERADGFWAVKIASDGLYEFSLRRWPREVKKPIIENFSIHKHEPEEDLFSATTARLKIADFDRSIVVNPDDTEVKFRVKLKKGETRAQAWFINGMGDGRTHGVYYVYVERIGA